MYIVTIELDSYLLCLAPTGTFPRVVIAVSDMFGAASHSSVVRFQAWEKYCNASSSSSLKMQVHESRPDGLRGGVWLR